LAVAEDFAINVDFAVLRREDGSPRTLLAWGDRVRVLDRTATKVEVEVTDFKEQPDGSIRPVAASGFLKRKLRVDGADRQVALPVDDVRVLQVAFVDVQQGDGALVQTPSAKPIEFRRLARGTDDAFDFLTEDGIAVEVLGPLETQVGNVSGLAFLAEPKGG
jgi:hypothetical protein